LDAAYQPARALSQKFDHALGGQANGQRPCK
jgi:hypothetical protein